MHEFLKGKRTRLLLQVHDSLLFELHESERDLLPQLEAIMCNVYPHKHLPMTVDCKEYPKAWGQKA